MRNDWTTAEDTRLIEMDAAGHSLEEIGKAVNRSPGGVKKRRHLLMQVGAIEPKPPVQNKNAEIAALFAAGKSDDEIAAEIGYTVKTVRQRRQGMGLLRAEQPDGLRRARRNQEWAVRIKMRFSHPHRDFQKWECVMPGVYARTLMAA